MRESQNILKEIKELNDRCQKKIEKANIESIKRDNAEYVIIRNYLQKKSFHSDELAELTNTTHKIVTNILRNLGFIKFKYKKLVVQTKLLNGLRRFTEDFINFLNYPKFKELNKSIDNINNFIKNTKSSKNFKIVLVAALESESITLFSEEELSEICSIIRNASWGISKYYFKQLYDIYLKNYPEIKSIRLDYIETEKEKKEDVEPDEILDEIEEEIDVKELIGENEKLSEDLSESRAVCDFIAMQYEDLKSKMEDTKKEAYDRILTKIFKNFNSLENNYALDTFFIARFTLNKLKKSGWEPSPPELNSVLFIFELFSEFFKRQGLTSKYDIGELIEITLENVDDFNYKGTEIRENMKVMTKVLSPAWYLKNKRISKVNVIEVNIEED